jgi:hypothetical protein
MTMEDRQHYVRDAVQSDPQKYAGKKLIQIVRELQLEMVSSAFFGGVYGCPFNIFGMENGCHHELFATPDKCVKCWRRVYPGKEVNK